MVLRDDACTILLICTALCAFASGITTPELSRTSSNAPDSGNSAVASALMRREVSGAGARNSDAGIKQPDTSDLAAPTLASRDESVARNVTSLHSNTKKHKRASTVHLLSFRSCSNNEHAPCNSELFAQLRGLSIAAAKVPIINQHHLFQGIPPEIENNPKWNRHIQDHHYGAMKAADPVLKYAKIPGRGYWFWKPALWNLLVRNGTFRDGDIVVWADADQGAAYMKLISTLAPFRQSIDMFAQYQMHYEADWTKADIFRKFGTNWSDPHYGPVPQVHAQFWVTNVNDRTREFMQHWEDLVADYHLVSNEKSKPPENPSFLENRNDQSLLSMLVHANRESSWPDVPCEGKTSGRDLLDTTPRNKTWKRHPVFGVPNLEVKFGRFEDFVAQARAQGRALPMLAEEEEDNTPVTPPVRRVCVQGRWFDLDVVEEPVGAEVTTPSNSSVSGDSTSREAGIVTESEQMALRAMLGESHVEAM